MYRTHAVFAILSLLWTAMLAAEIALGAPLPQTVGTSDPTSPRHNETPAIVDHTPFNGAFNGPPVIKTIEHALEAEFE